MPKKNKKKRKRRLNRDELRQTMAPTKDFEWPNPHDEDDIIIVTAQRLSPGHLLELDSSSLIKAYQQNTDESDANESQDSGEVDKDILDNFETIVSNVKYASEIASMAIIDPETGERIYTQEDCMLLLLPAWNTEVANFALAGAQPQKGEAADDVDRFPNSDAEQEAPEVEKETE